MYGAAQMHTGYAWSIREERDESLTALDIKQGISLTFAPVGAFAPIIVYYLSLFFDIRGCKPCSPEASSNHLMSRFPRRRQPGTACIETQKCLKSGTLHDCVHRVDDDCRVQLIVTSFVGGLLT